jgi:CBS domain-containing protein
MRKNALAVEGEMFSQRIRDVMEREKLLTAPPQTTVSEAATSMATRKVGAIMVVEGRRLVGIFTERDVVTRVIARGLDVRSTRLADVMTADPKTMSPEKSFGYAMLMMHEGGFRHVPVIENGEPVGIVSARNALDPDLEEFVAESRRREQLQREKA